MKFRIFALLPSAFFLCSLMYSPSTKANPHATRPLMIKVEPQDEKGDFSVKGHPNVSFMTSHGVIREEAGSDAMVILRGPSREVLASANFVTAEIPLRLVDHSIVDTAEVEVGRFRSTNGLKNELFLEIMIDGKQRVAKILQKGSSSEDISFDFILDNLTVAKVLKIAAKKNDDRLDHSSYWKIITRNPSPLDSRLLITFIGAEAEWAMFSNLKIKKESPKVSLSSYLSQLKQISKEKTLKLGSGIGATIAALFYFYWNRQSSESKSQGQKQVPEETSILDNQTPPPVKEESPSSSNSHKPLSPSSHSSRTFDNINIEGVALEKVRVTFEGISQELARLPTPIDPFIQVPLFNSKLSLLTDKLKKILDFFNQKTQRSPSNDEQDFVKSLNTLKKEIFNKRAELSEVLSLAQAELAKQPEEEYIKHLKTVKNLKNPQDQIDFLNSYILNTNIESIKTRLIPLKFLYELDPEEALSTLLASNLMIDKYSKEFLKWTGKSKKLTKLYNKSQDPSAHSTSASNVVQNTTVSRLIHEDTFLEIADFLLLKRELDIALKDAPGVLLTPLTTTQSNYDEIAATISQYFLKKGVVAMLLGNDRHWVLLAFASDGHSTILDSAETSSLVKNFKTKMPSLFSNLNKLMKQDNLFTQEKFYDGKTGQQKDHYNCMIYSLLYAVKILKDGNLGAVKNVNFNGNDLRDYYSFFGIQPDNPLYQPGTANPVQDFFKAVRMHINEVRAQRRAPPLKCEYPS